MLWQEQSWPVLQQMDKNTPVIIPLGSCEQHGPHMPVFVDTIQVNVIAEQVEKALGNDALLVPTLWLGSSHHHRDFPGTVSVIPSLYSEIIKSMAACILQAGFRRLFFLNGHGGNETPAAQALSEMVAQDDEADDAYLVLSTWWKIAGPALGAEKLAMDSPALSHACEYETSLMLILRPDLVKADRIRQGNAVLNSTWHPSENDPLQRVGVFRRFHRLTASGSMGNPSAATAEKGKAILEAVVPEVIAFVREFASWPQLPKLGPTYQ